jgi:hypothetical protein
MSIKLSSANFIEILSAIFEFLRDRRSDKQKRIGAFFKLFFANAKIFF